MFGVEDEMAELGLVYDSSSLLCTDYKRVYNGLYMWINSSSLFSIKILSNMNKTITFNLKGQ